MAQLSAEEFAGRFSACSRTLWCIAAAILGRAEADDVVQEAALIALRKIDGFDPATEFTAWMSQIVRYTALNAARRRRNQKTMNVDPAQLNDACDAPRTAAVAGITPRGELVPGEHAFDDGVLEALQDLEETARCCLLLRIVLDLPYREIALALGIPEGTAMSHVHRARKTLCGRLESRVKQS